MTAYGRPCGGFPSPPCAAALGGVTALVAVYAGGAGPGWVEQVEEEEGFFAGETRPGIRRATAQHPRPTARSAIIDLVERCTMEIPVYATGEVQMQVAHWLTVKQPEWVRFKAKGKVAEVYVRIDNTTVQLGAVAQRMLDDYYSRTKAVNETKSVSELCKFLNANAANAQYDFASYHPNYVEVAFYI